MIVPATGVITVYVVTAIILVTWVQCLDAHAARFHQDFLNLLQTDSSVFNVEKVRGIAHGYTKVGAKLVLSKGMSCIEYVFIYAASVNETFSDDMVFVFISVDRDPKA